MTDFPMDLENNGFKDKNHSLILPKKSTEW